MKRADPEDARCATRHDPVRGQGRDRAQQAARPRRAGRLGHQAPYRRNAGGAGGHERGPTCAGPSARPRHVGRAVAGQVAQEAVGMAGQPSAHAGRASQSTGRWWKACRSHCRAASQRPSPRARAWATSAARAARGRGRISSGCASPSTAIRTHRFADLYATRSTRSRRGSHGSRCGPSPGGPTSCAPMRRRSAIQSSATRNTTASAANDPARNDPLRAVPPGLEPKLHLLARLARAPASARRAGSM